MKVKDTYIAIIGALDAEISEFINHLEYPVKKISGSFEFYEGIFDGKNIVVVKCGVGKVFAAMTSQKLIDDYNPEYIIFTGVAGAINHDYEIGDVIIANDCVQHDLDATALNIPRGMIPYTSYRFLKTDKRLREIAASTPIEHKIHIGRILTGDLTKKALEEYVYLTRELNGDAVEMEGAAVAQVCTFNKIPFLIIRTISDKADEEAPLNFTKFLPVVTGNSFHIVKYILSTDMELLKEE